MKYLKKITFFFLTVLIGNIYGKNLQKEVEEALNTIKTLESDFFQDLGKGLPPQQGKIYVSRTLGRLAFVMQEKQQRFILTPETLYIIENGQCEEHDLFQSPMRYFFKPNIELSKELEGSFREENNRVFARISRSDEMRGFYIEFIFERIEEKLRLLGWVTNDATGVNVIVLNAKTIKINAPIDISVFQDKRIK